jgi:hypothetical protein
VPHALEMDVNWSVGSNEVLLQIRCLGVWRYALGNIQSWGYPIFGIELEHRLCPTVTGRTPFEHSNSRISGHVRFPVQLFIVLQDAILKDQKMRRLNTLHNLIRNENHLLFTQSTFLKKCIVLCFDVLKSKFYVDVVSCLGYSDLYFILHYRYGNLI